jgi:hypothetical protein
MLIDRIEKLESKINELNQIVSFLPPKLPLSLIAPLFNKPPKTILSRLKNNPELFEPDKDYFKIKNYWYIDISSLPKLQLLYNSNTPLNT